MPPLDDVPDECLERILEKAAGRADFALNLSLVCKRWHPIAFPLIYRDIVMHPGNAQKLLSALEDKKEKEVGKLVKYIICVSGGAGSGVGPSELTQLLALTPQVEELFIARFWHQWLSNAISLSPTMSNIRRLTLHFDYSPLPNPNPTNFMGQFSNWPSLEALTIRMLSFMDGIGGFAAVALAAQGHSPQATFYPPVTPNPGSKLKDLTILGNIIPPTALAAGLTALQAPLKELTLSSIALLGPEGVVNALQIVGKDLRSLTIYDDGRMGVIGSFSEILFPQLKALCPVLETLMIIQINFAEQSFAMLPSTLKELVVTDEKTLGASQVWKGLEAQIDLNELKDLKRVEWRSGKPNSEGWGEEDIKEFSAWGLSRSISVKAGHGNASEES